MTAPDSKAADEIESYRRRFGRPGMTAGEFVEFLPEHLRQPYWRQKITEYFRAEGLDPGDDGADRD